MIIFLILYQKKVARSSEEMDSRLRGNDNVEEGGFDLFEPSAPRELTFPDLQTPSTFSDF
jgi:hypothetical protein